MTSSTTRILVTGGDGMLAQALRAYFPFATYASRTDCDVTHSGAVKAAFAEANPQLVIHCAALTRHDAEPTAYVPTNVQGTANVMLQAKRCGARLVYASVAACVRSSREYHEPRITSVLWYDRATHSPAALLAAYGFTGASGAHSGYGPATPGYT